MHSDKGLQFRVTSLYPDDLASSQLEGKRLPALAAAVEFYQLHGRKDEEKERKKALQPKL